MQWGKHDIYLPDVLENKLKVPEKENIQELYDYFPSVLNFVSCFCRLVSAIHAALATTAGVIVVTSCRDTMTDT